MKSNLICLFLMSLLTMSCYSIYSTAQEPNANKIKRSPLPDLVFLIDSDNDGLYEIIEIEKENQPEPIQGNEQWRRDCYKTMKYPVVAKENGVQGTVILEVSIDQNGKVTHVGIKEGISIECDEESKRAYIYSTQNGYKPLMINNIPTAFKMEIPVRFRLG